eukprot:755073_1
MKRSISFTMAIVLIWSHMITITYGRCRHITDGLYSVPTQTPFWSKTKSAYVGYYFGAEYILDEFAPQKRRKTGKVYVTKEEVNDGFLVEDIMRFPVDPTTGERLNIMYADFDADQLMEFNTHQRGKHGPAMIL